MLNKLEVNLLKKGNNMTYITKLTEIVGGRLLPSDKKLSASLLEVDTGVPEVGAGRLTITGDTLGFDYTGLATESYVMSAIESAQLAGEEIDLSGYATKVDLLTKVDNVVGKGLSTNDYTTADKAKVDGIDTSISTAVNAAIASVVDNAPATFDTLKEIATWIETEGVDTAELAAGIAGKADRTELSDYATFVSMTQLEGQVSDGLSNKVDKEAGKGLSTNDFTNSYKDQLDNVTTTVDTQIDNKFNNVYGPSIAANLEDINTQLGTKLDHPDAIHPAAFTTPTVNSIPLYTLGNNGDYVLCTPDAWLNINGLLVPGYSATTLGV